jgi:hypothetical protein
LYIDYRNAYDCYNFGIAQALAMAKRRFNLSRDLKRVALQQTGAQTVPQPRAPPPSAPALPAHGVLGDVDGWLLEACLSICVLRGNFLTTQLSQTYIAMARACSSSALFTSTPLAAALTKPIFQVVVFITGLLSLLACIMAIYSYNVLGFVEYRHYRFNVVRFRDADLQQAGGWRGLSSFGLLLDMCPLRDSPTLWRGVGAAGNSSSVIASFPSPVRANGWLFSTAAADSPVMDPVEFALDGSDDLLQWLPVASESTTIVCGIFGSQLSFPHHGRPEHVGGTPVRFDLRPDLCWLLSWVMVTSFAVVWWWALLALSHARASCMWYRRVAAVGMGAMGLGFGIPAVIRAYALGLRNELMRLYALGPIATLCAFLVYVAEGKCAYWLGPLCACLLAADVLLLWQEGALDLPPLAVIFSPFLVVGLSGTCLSAALLVARRYFLGRADTLILPDLARYEAVWAEVVSDEDSLQALHELRAVSKPYENAGRPRQLCPPLRAGQCLQDEEAEPGPPIKCLNQLMTAAQVHPGQHTLPLRSHAAVRGALRARHPKAPRNDCTRRVEVVQGRRE